jgi:flagellar biosynthesis/type III secretory pathway chaperone
MDLFQKLMASLVTEADTAAELLALLEKEAHALASRDTQAILDLCLRKQCLAERLAEGETMRHRCLEGSGLPRDLPTLEAALKAAGATTVASACQHLGQLATTCAERNRRNGALVEGRLRHVRRALEVITGHTPAVELYGPALGQRKRAWVKA